ncbi:MAG: hypothetical protein ABW034_06205, partial [Steroidobacteraceae bacterium]
DRIATALRRGGARVVRVQPTGIAVARDAVSVDFLDPDAIRRLFDTLQGDGAAPSMLVVAPELKSGPFRDALANALDAPFFWQSEFARRRIALGLPGSSLHVLSAHSGPADAVAQTAQHALANMIKSLAVEWARDGLRTNGLVVGEDLDSAANLALYVLSDYGAYITGTVSIAAGPHVGSGLYI